MAIIAVFLLLALRSPIAGAAEALEWKRSDHFRSAALTVPAEGKPGFTMLPPGATGIAFTNAIARSRYTTNQIYLNGSGVTAGDMDGDGLCDLFFAGLGGASALYRNLGSWKFENVTKSSGVNCTDLDASGVAFADIDGDGDLDLVINSVGGGLRIFLNDGHGKFTVLTSSSPLNPARGGSSMALADVDGDGDLDLYVANYRTSTIRDQPGTRIKGENINGVPVIATVNGRPATEPDLMGRFTVEASGKIIEHGEPDVLLLNDGAGRFSPVSFTGGAFLDEDGRPLPAPPYDWSLSVMFRDMNDDRAPDIYVCGDFSAPDRIWMNDGSGHFRAAPRLAVRRTSMFSMGVDFADINRDGFDDFFCADMLSRDHRRRQTQVGDLVPVFLSIGQIDNRPQYPFNTLHLNRGDATYAEVAHFSGVQASEWSWTPVFLDVDLDGFEDLLITNGHERDAMNADVMGRAEAMKAERKISGSELLNLNNLFARLDTPNIAFRNRGDLTFEDASAAWGFNTPGVSHGMALADLDNDGDLDVVVNNLNGVAGIYRNEAAAPRIAVRLRGVAPNTRGIGAKIRVLNGAVPMQSQEIIYGGRYLSSDDPMRVFAAGALTNKLRVEVVWRSGLRSVIAEAQANRLFELDESGAFAAKMVVPEKPVPWFEDVSAALKHVHHEEPFDDFALQPLLPHRLSQLGPGVAWQDFDGDGREDLMIGSGRGGLLAVYRNEGSGKFSSFTNAATAKIAARDQTAVVGIDSMVFVGSNNYEDGSNEGGAIRVYDLKRGASGGSVLNQAITTGPLALADVDGDGDLDLFIGGRMIAGRYPEPAASVLMRNDGGRFTVLQRFENFGLVSSAVFSDLDGDGKPELILACEWGPVRVFEQKDGSYREITERLGLGSYLGLWNGVTTADLDNDGRLDIIVSNWGLNSHYQTGPSRNRRLHFGDLSGRGTVDILESHLDSMLSKDVPDRSFKTVSAAIPFVKELVGSYAAYSSASVAEICGDRFKQMKSVEATTLASMVFLNRGDHFEAQALPTEAQLAPAFGICIADADGDGNEDVFLSQNFFAMNPDTPRCDAGRGLWLKGDGKGALSPVPAVQSGVTIYGEQRGCAVADYDGDGRVDLVVTQNGAATKLYHNTTGKPGLRVRLRGPSGNARTIGAALRLKFGGRWGALREIHAGSGYWSQDGSIQVLGTREEPTQLSVRWPGGKTTVADVPQGAGEITVDIDGSVKVSP